MDEQPKVLTVTSTNERRSGLFSDSVSVTMRSEFAILDFFLNDLGEGESPNIMHQARLILTPTTLAELRSLIDGAPTGGNE